MQNVKLRLDAWRDAERRRDRLAPGSPEWQEADEDARNAAKAFHAEVAQASARYAEEDFQDRRPWSLPSDRRTSPAADRWWTVTSPGGRGGDGLRGSAG